MLCLDFKKIKMEQVEFVTQVRAIQRRFMIINHNFRFRGDPFVNLNDSEFRNRYRLTKEAVRFVVNQVKDKLECNNIRDINISPELQVLVTLRYFAKGCYQPELGRY